MSVSEFLRDSPVSASKIPFPGFDDDDAADAEPVGGTDCDGEPGYSDFKGRRILPVYALVASGA